MNRLLKLFFISLIFCAGCKKNTEVSVETKPYKGWPEAVHIANKTAKVVVVPSIGRIMYYGFLNDSNLLWNNPDFNGITLPKDSFLMKNGFPYWANFGGDKVWPTQQRDFRKLTGRGFPPDQWFDGSQHRYTLFENGVEIESPVSKYNGAKCIRSITLATKGPEVNIEQKIVKVNTAQNKLHEPISFTIWSVTQIELPEFAILQTNSYSKIPSKYRVYQEWQHENVELTGNVAVFYPDSARNQKIGADSQNWLGAIHDNIIIGQFFTFNPSLIYPDEGQSAEVFTNLKYMELELLSPLADLRIGEEIRYDIKWNLNKIPSNLKSKKEKLSYAINWLNTCIK